MLPPDPYLKLSQFWKAARGPASFILGAGIIVYEMIGRGTVDVQWLVLGGGLVGAPFFTPNQGV